VDVTYTEWRSEEKLLVAGHRGSETVVGLVDAELGTFSPVWASSTITTGGRYASVAGLDDASGFALLGESYVHAPEIAVVREGEYRAVRSFDVGYSNRAQVIGSFESVSWRAPDGLPIQGWVLLPKNSGPHPLVMSLHGGPVWQSRPTCLRGSSTLTLMLLRRGYAIFYPNPRGSAGYGQEFIRHVVGDMGGKDTHDCLSGIDYLVARGIADSTRLGVMGSSYGGFMTSWLFTQDSRLAAAVPFSPTTNQVTEHLLGNIPHFVQMFLQDTYSNLGGRYFERAR
jgi:dipeptidyl aminopeptidase/acylaminoacyl peptidase